MGHVRIKHPRPLAAAVDSPAGNYYNAPLRADGSDFPCKGLHKKAGVDMTPTETWEPGQQTRFEILGHGTSSGEGSMAAHSGGSCQASLSFDNGETWKVLHSYIGGCPRDARLGSNIAGKNQTFTFIVPENTKAGNALFSWSWIAVTGNRNEYYQNCASVKIAGSGTSKLNDLPDMFLGDMSITGHILSGECRSFSGNAIEYPNPGNAYTITKVQSIGFKKPTDGKCYTKASGNQSATSATSISTVSRTSLSSTTSAAKSQTTSRLLTSITSRMQTTSKGSVTSSTAKATTISIETAPNGQLPSQCSTYMIITDKTRHSSQPGYIGCDNAIFKSKTEPTWVRFSGAAGTRLVTGRIEPHRCGTQGTGWYSGSYPSASGVTVSGKVCFSWPNADCQWSNTISITKCNDYFVFALTAPPACYLRYCTV